MGSIVGRLIDQRLRERNRRVDPIAQVNQLLALQANRLALSEAQARAARRPELEAREDRLHSLQEERTANQIQDARVDRAKALGDLDTGLEKALLVLGKAQRLGEFPGADTLQDEIRKTGTLHPGS